MHKHGITDFSSFITIVYLLSFDIVKDFDKILKIISSLKNITTVNKTVKDYRRHSFEIFLFSF